MYIHSPKPPKRYYKLIFSILFGRGDLGHCLQSRRAETAMSICSNCMATALPCISRCRLPVSKTCTWVSAEYQSNSLRKLPSSTLREAKRECWKEVVQAPPWTQRNRAIRGSALNSSVDLISNNLSKKSISPLRTESRARRPADSAIRCRCSRAGGRCPSSSVPSFLSHI